MKTTASWFGLLIIFVILLLVASVTSCQKDDFERGMTIPDSRIMTNIQTAEPVIWYGPEYFAIASKDPVNETRVITGENFGYLQNFIITVQNGISGNTRVNKIEIQVNGLTVISHNDFKGRKNLVSKPVGGLTRNSRLTVKLDGPKGRFVIISIQGYLKPDVITDIDGNYYKTVEICGRWWMAENLKATRFNDGTPLVNITDNAEWLSYAYSDIPAYCWYNNDIAYKQVYGALYNSQVGKEYGNDKNICPAGWHVPDSHFDLYEMLLCLDPDAHETTGPMSEIAGSMLKEAGTAHWQAPNTGTNSTGFTALPGGRRMKITGQFDLLGLYGTWWTDNGLAFFGMGNESSAVGFVEGGDEYGFSIRCIKDQP